MDRSASAAAIIKNIENGGLYRYDSSDLDRFYTEKFGTFKDGIIRKTLRAMDVMFPFAARRIVGCKKTLNPMVYYHLGLALLYREKYNIPVQTTMSAQSMADDVVQYLYDNSTHLWDFPDLFISAQANTLVAKHEKPTLHMHGLARLNILLLEVWRQYQREDLLQIAVDSAAAAIRQHNITEYDDGSAAISYYYNSQDNTPNVNSEFLQWIAELPADRRPPEAADLGHKILKRLLLEQNADGSFFYRGKDYMRQNNISPTIDNHHSSYVLNNLIHVLMSDFPMPEERPLLLQACINGMEFSLSRLFHEQTGLGVYQIDNVSRKAEPVTYSEAVFAFCSYLRCSDIPAAMHNRIRALLPKVMSQLLTLVNQKDGSVPSECVFGKWSNINSIRWGNGPVLQAIFDVYALEQEEI